MFTLAELAAYRGRAPSLAARWAAKIEVLSDAQGRPTLTLYGAAADRARAMRLGQIALSLSHTREHAIASVVALDEEIG